MKYKISIYIISSALLPPINLLSHDQQYHHHHHTAYIIKFAVQRIKIRTVLYSISRQTWRRIPSKYYIPVEKEETWEESTVGKRTEPHMALMEVSIYVVLNHLSHVGVYTPA